MFCRLFVCCFVVVDLRLKKKISSILYNIYIIVYNIAWSHTRVFEEYALSDVYARDFWQLGYQPIKLQH